LPGPADASTSIIWAFVLFSASTILIAAVDASFQLWEQTKQLKLSKQELKDEIKETEGKSEVKSRIRKMQQQLANRRMFEEVPKANVVITNPTHYSVALKYDKNKMGAPRVVAMGVNYMAHRIRLIADQHKVILFSASLLARAIYFNTKLDQKIPAGLYFIVAQVLTYVFQLKANRTDRNIPTPEKLSNISIPDEYRKY